MIQDHMVSILGWIQYEKVRWLQNNNPEVPGLVYKLAPLDDKMRKLGHVRKLWEGILDFTSIIDVFKDEPIKKSAYDVDHFIPWSFVMNDELCNLMPMDSSLNSVKSNRLPQFLKFIQDDNVYYKYYNVVYILFHTGMRISEFCGLTLSDIDLENNIINIDHQLLRDSSSVKYIQSTKTNAGTRKLPIKDDVAECFSHLIADRPKLIQEKMIDGYGGFLCIDEEGNPLVAMHWEHRFNHMVKRYNDIFRIQMPNITPHVCCHTYCSNQARAGMNPKTLQYLMGHSEIGVTMNTYTHLGLDDAKDEMIRLEELEQARKEIDKTNGIKPMKQNMFKAI